MNSSQEAIVRDRLKTVSGKEFQRLFWDILSCIYPDLQTPRMQHDLGNDGYSLGKKSFFAMYAIENLPYDNTVTKDKINEDYVKFETNWKDKFSFTDWVFVTKDDIMGIPHQHIVELSKKKDGINKLHCGLQQVVQYASQLNDDDLCRIFNIPSNEGSSSQSEEVMTIMDLISYITENTELSVGVSEDLMPDPDKKLERFAKYLKELKNEIIESSMYAVAQKNAESIVGLDKITVDKKVAFLKTKSRRFLRENNDDPMVSLDKMTDFLESELKKAGKKYCHNAIRYYLIGEIPKCNIFPNE